MCRLTEKNKQFACTECLNCIEGRKIEDQYNKLQQLEDFEDELNFDLIILFKALKGGFYVKTKDINEGFISLVKAKDIREINIIIESITFNAFDIVLFEDYGKTWALTKEELEVK